MKHPPLALVAVAALVTALVGVDVPEARAASATVSVRDNVFSPQEVRIEPGDSVVWNYGSGRNTHTVTSDEPGLFDSGDMRPTSNRTFTRTFREAGTYPYFCRYHGAPGGAGMSGVVVVGDPQDPSPGDGPDHGRDGRPKLVVPTDFSTIQKAVDAARPGSTVVIRPGIYRESVTVSTPRLVIRGVDRFRTVLHGGDSKENGIFVDGASDVAVKNLTVRNYLHSGIFFDHVTGYLARRIDSIKNRTYGIHASNSYSGVIRDSFGWGSGDSAFSIERCLGCSALIENVHSEMNYLGYSGANATGVIIRDSTFIHNGAGVVPQTLSSEELAPNRGTTIINNLVAGNNYENVPAAGLSERAGIPFGTGIWLAGVRNNVANGNLIRDHKRYGVLISQSIDGESTPINNRVRRNIIRGSGIYDLAYDGTGSNNCFYRNDLSGPTGPPDAATLYSCPRRPNTGTPYPPVQEDVTASTSNAQTREQIEPPEPRRPRCQKGAPGCNR